MSRAEATFAWTFGRAPDGVWSAPGRVNLIGEHTDYNDGFVLPMAIPQRIRVAAARRDDTSLRLFSVRAQEEILLAAAECEPGAIRGWAAYPAGVVWALRDAGKEIGGLDLVVDGDVPRGAGLSSSAALECATALAALELHGDHLDRWTVAMLARKAEHDFVGMPCGIMDQAAAMLCVRGHALFLDTRTAATEKIPLDLEAMGLAVVVVDTRAPHRLVDGEYAERRRTCEQAASVLGVKALRDIEPPALEEILSRLSEERMRRRVRHVVTENARVLETVRLLQAGKAREIGSLLTESHASLRDDYEVTVSELDTAVEAALAADALGARMTGGGLGGCVIALVEVDGVDACVASVEKAFRRRGFPQPAHFVAVPSDGAHQEA
ncbi:MAG: galactokinase [Haloechinothrix sp.]